MTAGAEPTVASLIGRDIGDAIDELAALRIRVFREWPYLYDGDADYEARYLADYAASPRSIAVTVRAPDGSMVGAATGTALADHDAALAAAVARAGVDPGTALAVVSAHGHLGILFMPASIGWAGEHVGFGATFAGLAALPLAIALLAPVGRAAHGGVADGGAADGAGALGDPFADMGGGDDPVGLGGLI